MTAQPGAIAMVGRIDDAVDRLFEPLRGNPTVDAAAKVVSIVGDHGYVWTAVATWRGRRSGPQRRAAIRALGLAGVSSALCNAAIKQVVQRSRPDTTELALSAAGLPVRTPTSSSFPSGHTLAAFCAATVLTRPGHRGANAALLTCAGAIGISRIHLRAHHASDVIGGVIIGTLLGRLVRRFR